MIGKKGLGTLKALASDTFGTFAIAPELTILTIELTKQCPQQSGWPRIVGQPKVDPAAFLHPGQEAGVVHQFQMTTEPRLALAQDLGQIFDG